MPQGLLEGKLKRRIDFRISARVKKQFNAAIRINWSIWNKINLPKFIDHNLLPIIYFSSCAIVLNTPSARKSPNWNSVMSENIPPNTIPQFSLLKLETFQRGKKFKGVMIDNNDVHKWRRLTQIANFLKI